MTSRQLGSLLLIYALLAGWFASHTPLLEAPDAYYHFAVIEHIGRTGERPPTEHPENYPWRQMTFHAPLYYYLSAILISPIDTSDFPDAYRLNTHAQIGEPHAGDNQNFVAHVGDPWAKTGLAIRVVQAFSIVLGAITLLSIFALARRVLPNRPSAAWIAVGIVLFNPQFLFITTNVSNDNLVIALTSLSLVLVVRILQQGYTWRDVLILGVVVAGASLAKTSGLTVLPIALFAIALTPASRLARWQAIAAILGLWVVLAGWWYAENWLQHGDLFGTRLVAEATGARTDAIDYVGELRGLYFSFWGLFGWFNIIAPSTYYDAVTVWLGIAAVGMLYGLRHYRRFDWRMVGILALYTGGFLLSWFSFLQIVVAGQGRLWFPLLGIMACGLAWGLTNLPHPLNHVIPGVVLTGMLITCIAFPITLIAPAYEPAPTLAHWSPHADALAFDFREPWAERACLRLWLTPTRLETDTDTLTITFWLESLCPMSGYWSEFIHLVDLNQEQCVVGDTRYILTQHDTMPSGGDLPVPAFDAGMVIQDELSVQRVAKGENLAIQIGFYDAAGTFIRALITTSATEDNFAYLGKCGAEVITIPID